VRFLNEPLIESLKTSRRPHILVEETGLEVLRS
jgi:hypothetical protein